MSVAGDVKEIIMDSLHVEEREVTGQASLMDDLGADSLDAVSIILDLEERFQLSITDKQAEKMKTVADVVTFVEQKLTK